jgi:hypothetical protein
VLVVVDPTLMRWIISNIIAFLTMTGIFNCVGYVVGGLLTEERVAWG